MDSFTSNCLDHHNKDGGDIDDAEESSDKREQERQHFFDIVNTFRYYKFVSLRKISNELEYIEKMPPKHQEKLSSYVEHLNNLKVGVAHNFEVIKLFLSDVEHMFTNISYDHVDPRSRHYHGTKPLLKIKKETELNTSRINSVLSQVAREWSAQGVDERTDCYMPILEAIDAYFASVPDRKQLQILVPGAGLGRLAFEISLRGYSCQGNEFSLVMLIVANFILNRSECINAYTLYPWISQFSNNVQSRDQLLTIKFPDVNPKSLPKGVHFSMAAGSFTDVYYEPEQWHCVATCFFIDTAPNICEYIETIWTILKPDGVWINFGPLLYHFADAISVEPSYEIVRNIILSYGFVFVKEQTDQESFYTRNPNSMLQYKYKSVFFICKKPVQTQCDTSSINNSNESILS